MLFKLETCIFLWLPWKLLQCCRSNKSIKNPIKKSVNATLLLIGPAAWIKIYAVIYYVDRMYKNEEKVFYFNWMVFLNRVNWFISVRENKFNKKVFSTFKK